MGDFSSSETRGRVQEITINRPEVMNALHWKASKEISDLFDAFVEDRDLWVSIITGSGEKAFCAGNDLKFQAAGDGQRRLPHGFCGITARFDNTKPVIAAVNGLAMGGGFEIVLACDIVIASETAFFALPEPRVGLAAGAGGMQRLPREIGLKRALGMMLTGRRVSAQEGRELGFVNEVVAPGEVMEAARAWADQILECGPLSVRASKEVAYKSMSMASLEDSLNAEYPTMKTLRSSKDFIEGPKAFAEKRAPNWRGE